MTAVVPIPQPPAAGGRRRPPEAHPVHPVRHGAHLPGPGRAADPGPGKSRQRSFQRLRCQRLRRHHPRQQGRVPRHLRGLHDRRHAAAHVARRADHPARHRQRRLAAHHHRHPGRHPRRRPDAQDPDFRPGRRAGHQHAAVADDGRALRHRHRRHHHGHPGPAEDPGAVCQARRRAKGVRRPELLPAAQGQLLGRHAGDLRRRDPAVPRSRSFPSSAPPSTSSSSANSPRNLMRGHWSTTPAIRS